MSIILAGSSTQIFDKLMNKGLDIAVFFYVDKEFSEHKGRVKSIFYEDLFYDKEYYFVKDLDDGISDQVRQLCYSYFIRTYYRLPERQNPKKESWLDFNNIFESYVQYYKKIITENNIDHIIFGKIPHQGSVIILYYLAKVMNLKCTVVMQSIFSNGFWISDSISSIGDFKNQAIDHSIIEITDSPTSPAYMEGAKKYNFSDFLWKSIKLYSKKFLKIASTSFFMNRKASQKVNIKIRDNYRLYRQHHLPSKVYEDFNEKVKYIYFPLHLQPEMTTDILGEEYCDQILAIERLSRVIPEDFIIYVKENPKQSTYMRDGSFYRRLLCIENVRYVNVDVPTYKLIAGSRAVATVTGTAGWEALQMRKPVICFGLAWYRKLYGAFEWKLRPEWSMPEILDFNFDYELFRSSVLGLQKHLWPGVPDPQYLRFNRGLSVEENADKVADSIMKYISGI